MEYKVLDLIDSIERSKSYKEYKDYHKDNIFGIAGVARSELLHSNFIAWILDPKATHGLGHYPLYQFIRSLRVVKKVERNEKSRLDEGIILRFYDNDFIVDAKVEREKESKVEKKKGRIDVHILIQTKEGKALPVIIENKVDSDMNGKKKDQSDQSDHYFKWGDEIEYKDKERYFPPIYILLVPLYKKGKVECSNKNYLEMTYQDLVDNVFDPAYGRCSNSVAKEHIGVYLQSLSYLTDYKKGEGTMAITEKEKDILDHFYRENANLFITVIDMLVENGDIEVIDGDTIKKTFEKSLSRYKFNGKEYGVGRLALAIVKKYVEENNDIDYEALSETFPDKIVGGGHRVVIREKDVKDKDIKRYFSREGEKIELKKKDRSGEVEIVLVCREWGASGTNTNIRKLIEKAKELNIIREDNFTEL